MIDIKFIRENISIIEEAIVNKGINLDLSELLVIDDKRRDLINKIDNLRAKKKRFSQEISGLSLDFQKKNELMKQNRKIKEQLAEFEVQMKETLEKLDELSFKVPTIISPDTPIGKNDADNIEIYRSNNLPQFSFTPKNHIQLGQDLDILDLQRGAKVSGYRGYYVKNEGVSLMLGCMMYAVSKMVSRGYAPMLPPTLVKGFALFGSGYFKSQQYNPEVDEIYQVAASEKEGDGRLSKERKFLVGTAEPSLLSYYANEVLSEQMLPLKICGFSQCYRSEIGSYGKDTKGLYRVHEFMKVEQVVILKADISESVEIQDEMLKISKEMHEELGLPYRILQICTGDLSPGKYRSFDIEAWMPGLNRWGETGSSSNLLDWQAKRLNVKYETAGEERKRKYVYMLNNTALPSPRIFIAILEHYQQADGSIVIPEVIRRFMPVATDVIRKKTHKSAV